MGHRQVPGRDRDDKAVKDVKFKTMRQVRNVFGPENVEDKRIAVNSKSDEVVTGKLLWSLQEAAQDSPVDYGHHNGNI